MPTTTCPRHLRDQRDNSEVLAAPLFGVMRANASRPAGESRFRRTANSKNQESMI